MSVDMGSGLFNQFVSLASWTLKTSGRMNSCEALRLSFILYRKCGEASVLHDEEEQ